MTANRTGVVVALCLVGIVLSGSSCFYGNGSGPTGALHAFVTTFVDGGVDKCLLVDFNGNEVTDFKDRGQAIIFGNKSSTYTAQIIFTDASQVSAGQRISLAPGQLYVTMLIPTLQEDDAAQSLNFTVTCTDGLGNVISTSQVSWDLPPARPTGGGGP